MNQPVEIILTGDRPTGPLHLGHFVGSLRGRVELQQTHQQYVMIADAQALTDNMAATSKVASNVFEVALDYLAVGIDPSLTTICVQSCLPALAELTMLYLNLVTVARLERNPTVKQEIGLRGFNRDIPAGFLCYPVAQAADITAFKATVVPVGSDQLPMIEQSNEIVRRLNRLADRELLPESRALLSSTARLPGVDGQSKMSKSAGNSIPLNSSKDDVAAAVRRMFTDPKHLRASDPGRVEGNVVFTYLDAFDDHPDEVEALKEHYRRGGLGDSVVKKRLADRLNAILTPIRDKRAEFASRPDFVRDVLKEGTERAMSATRATLEEVRSALGMFTCR